MGVGKTYDEYFEAFEAAFDSDEWEVVGAFFTDDAVYEAPRGGRVEGRDAILAHFKASLDQFDRQFPVKRRIEVIEAQVVEQEDYLKVPGNIHYTLPGSPTLIFYMEEEAWFQDGRIARLVDTIPPDEAQKMMDYVQEHLGG